MRRKSYSSPYHRPGKHEKGAFRQTLIPSIRFVPLQAFMSHDYYLELQLFSEICLSRFDIEETPERITSPARLRLHRLLTLTYWDHSHSILFYIISTWYNTYHFSERTPSSCLSALSYFRESSPTSCLPLLNTSILNPATPLSLHSPSSTTSLLVPSASLSLLSPCSNTSPLAPPMPSNSTGVQQNAPRLAVKTSKKSKKPQLSINTSDMTTIIIKPCLKPIGLTPVRRSFKSAMDEGRDAASMEEVDLIDDDEVFIKDLDSNIVHKLSLRDMPNLPATFWKLTVSTDPLEYSYVLKSP